MKDVINPDHYKRIGNMECIEAIEAMVSGWPPETAYRLGNALKYLWRHQEKGGVESLQKAVWYLRREISAQTEQRRASPKAKRGSSGMKF